MKYQDSYEHVFADYCKALLAMLIALFWSAAQTLLTSPFYSVAFLAAYYVGLASAAATVICSIIILEDFTDSPCGVSTLNAMPITASILPNF